MDAQTTSPITFVTGNANKLAELQAIAGAAGRPERFEAESIDLGEIQSLDLQVIIEHKLRQAYDRLQRPVIAEDVSAGLDSLNGLPGPFIKFFEKQLGRGAMYKLTKVAEDGVTITCTAGYYDGQRMLFGNGTIRGRIVAPRGEHGFGFDCVVVPDDQTAQPDGRRLTMAEMPPEDKNLISHRAQALRNLLAQLQ